MSIKTKLSRANRSKVKACGCCLGPHVQAVRAAQDVVDEVQGIRNRRPKRRKARVRGCQHYEDRKHRYEQRLRVVWRKVLQSDMETWADRASYCVDDWCACGKYVPRRFIFAIWRRGLVKSAEQIFAESYSHLPRVEVRE